MYTAWVWGDSVVGQLGARRSSNSSVFVPRVAAVLLGVVAAVAGEVAAEAPRNRFDVIVVDAGHGGEDEGARGAGGLVEKTLVLDVSRRLAERLRGHGFEVVLTRDRDDFVPLETRTSVANDARGDLFISVHANASPSAKPRGIEAYFVSLDASDAGSAALAELENEALGASAPASLKLDPVSAILGDMEVNEHVRESSQFAKLAHKELVGLGVGGGRGVKQAPFVVLMGVRMPAALLEIGFLSNRGDERVLGRGGHRDAIADAIARAVVAFGRDYDRRRGVIGAAR